MIPALKSEFRKLFTVRSTYGVIAFVLFLDVFFGGFIKGYKLEGAQLLSHTALQESSLIAITLMGVFAALIGAFSLTYEYRYNTILYSLTSNRSRTVFLASKIISVTALSLVLTAFIAATAPLLASAGVHLAGHDLVAQNFAYADVAWRTLFYGWGYAMAALLIAALVRSQIATIATLFLVPSTVEGLLSILLKNNVYYLPFSALGAVIDDTINFGHAKAALVFTAYLVVGWLVAWVLMLRRDAN